MNDAIIAAVIAAVTALFGTITYLVVELRKERHQRNSQQSDFQRALAATSATAAYPYSFDSISITADIPNVSGAAINERTTTGVRPLVGTTIQAVTGVISTSGRFVEEPHLVSHSRPDTHLQGYFAGEQEFRFQVLFQNAVVADDPSCAFVVRWQEEDALLVVASDIERRYARGYESLSYTVSIPIIRLELAVRWPMEADYDSFPSVTFGPTETVATAEQRRITRGFVQKASGVQLVIDKPQVGMRYMIAWRGTRSIAASQY